MPEPAYQIEYLPTAENDLAEIITYLHQKNRDAARTLLAGINQGISRLSGDPYCGSEPKDEIIQKTGHRFMIVGKYLIFYVVRSQTIEIRRILHSARDIQVLLS